ncbi:hypothetical protein EI693_07530 [Pseudomonas oryziphila]|uniref:Uncharacterized protein n=1 Tax=Pseudomonas oryziphila TaxID=2894079 RepID=A0ABN5TFC4_9PSED|nr:hypothetical protein EI693_07530 [Pseudomonas oryziphila]
MPASSRVNPLPQLLLCDRNRRWPCGSGFTREEAGTGQLDALHEPSPSGSVLPSPPQAAPHP